MTANKKPVLEQVAEVERTRIMAEMRLFAKMAEVYWEHCNDEVGFIQELKNAGWGCMAMTFESFLSKDASDHKDDLMTDQSALV